MIVCGGYDFRSRRPCEREAEETITAGCVHEHIGLRLFCGGHASDARNGIMLCGDCQEVDGHRCTLHVLERCSAMPPSAPESPTDAPTAPTRPDDTTQPTGGQENP